MDLARTELINKQREYLTMFQKKEETIEAFVTRCIKMHNLLNRNKIHLSQTESCEKFLMGLGPLFMEVQQTP